MQSIGVGSSVVASCEDGGAGLRARRGVIRMRDRGRLCLNDRKGRLPAARGEEIRLEWEDGGRMHHFAGKMRGFRPPSDMHSGFHVVWEGVKIVQMGVWPIEKNGESFRGDLPPSRQSNDGSRASILLEHLRSLANLQRVHSMHTSLLHTVNALHNDT